MSDSVDLQVVEGGVQASPSSFADKIAKLVGSRDQAKGQRSALNEQIANLQQQYMAWGDRISYLQGAIDALSEIDTPSTAPAGGG